MTSTSNEVSSGSETTSAAVFLAGRIAGEHLPGSPEPGTDTIESSDTPAATSGAAGCNP